MSDGGCFPNKSGCLGIFILLENSIILWTSSQMEYPPESLSNHAEVMILSSKLYKTVIAYPLLGPASQFTHTCKSILSSVSRGFCENEPHPPSLSRGWIWIINYIIPSINIVLTSFHTRLKILQVSRILPRYKTSITVVWKIKRKINSQNESREKESPLGWL